MRNLKLPVTFFANFSPYHDPDPVSDFYDDSAQRITSVVAMVFAVHIMFFFMMSPNFIMPDMKDDEPEAIAVELIILEPEPPKVTPPKPEPKASILPKPVQSSLPQSSPALTLPSPSSYDFSGPLSIEVCTFSFILGYGHDFVVGS